MPVPTIYRSSHPTVLAAFDAHVAAAQEHADRLRVFLSAHLPDGYRPAINWGWGNGGRIVGFTHPDGGEPPAGWRAVDRGAHRLVVPKKNTAAGRLAAAALEAVVAVPDVRASLPMPFMVMTNDHTVHTPGVVRRDDVVWVRWGCDLEAIAHAEYERAREDEAAGVRRGRNVERPDPELWELVPLSAYYALAEAGQDPFARE